MGLGRHGGRSHQQRRAQQHGELVLQVTFSELTEEKDSGEGRGNRADDEPADQAEVDGAPVEVHERAHRLHGEGSHEIVGDGGQGRDVEDQNQQGGEQSAAAHAGQADDQADPESGHDDG